MSGEHGIKSIGSALETSLPTLQDAIRAFGSVPQILQANEEMGELVAALNQWRRDRVPFSAVEDEIADVLIVVTQMALLGGDGSLNRVAEAVKRKSLRLQQSIELKRTPQSTNTFDFWR